MKMLFVDNFERYENNPEAFYDDYGINYDDYVSMIEKKLKGDSLLELPSDYTVIDLETTDLSCQFGEIIEMAGIKVRNNEIADRYQQLVKPNDLIPEFITQINGITNEMVENCPRIDEVLKDFLDFIGDDIVIGHNIVSFDSNFIYMNAYVLYNRWFSNDMVDILRISRRLFPREHNRLSDLIVRFNLEGNQEHRALSDCEYTKKSYDCLVSYINENGIVFDSVKRHYHKKYNLKDLSPESFDFDEDNPFYNKEVVFTGTLERFIRKDAAQIVVNCGGSVGNNVTKNTNFLVIADTGYREQTNKMKKANECKQKGYDIETIPESLFYQMLFDY